MSGPAVPLLGDIAGYTVAPIASRLIWPLLIYRTIPGSGHMVHQTNPGAVIAAIGEAHELAGR